MQERPCYGVHKAYVEQDTLEQLHQVSDQELLSERVGILKLTGTGKLAGRRILQA